MSSTDLKHRHSGEQLCPGEELRDGLVYNYTEQRRHKAGRSVSHGGERDDGGCDGP